MFSSVKKKKTLQQCTNRPADFNQGCACAAGAKAVTRILDEAQTWVTMLTEYANADASFYRSTTYQKIPINQIETRLFMLVTTDV